MSDVLPPFVISPLILFYSILFLTPMQKKRRPLQVDFAVSYFVISSRICALSQFYLGRPLLGLRSSDLFVY